MLAAAVAAHAGPLAEISGDYTISNDAGEAIGAASISASGVVKIDNLTFQCYPDPDASRNDVLFQDGTVAFRWKETPSGLLLTAPKAGGAASTYNLVAASPTPYQKICGIAYSIVRDPSDQDTVIGWLYLLKPSTPLGATTIKVNREPPMWVQPEGYRRELLDRDGNVAFRWVERPFGVVMWRIRNGAVVARYNLVHIVYPDPEGGPDEDPPSSIR